MISKKRKEMGEEAWSIYQQKRKYDKWKKYSQTKKGIEYSLKVTISRQRKKRLLVEYKGGKCEICEYNKPIYDVYDFHHIDPTTKSFNISFEGKNLSFETLKKEADKCQLLCSNCHRTLHWEEKTKLIELKIRNLQNQLINIKPANQNIENKKPTKVCKFCKKEFIAKRKEQKFCCKTCANKSYIK